MLSEFLQSICTNVAAIPLVGAFVGGICNFYVSILSAFGL